jgi:hypothetical protein
LPGPNWSRALSLPLPLTIPTVMDLVTLADVRTLLGHLPKETRAKSTWQHVESELKKAAAGGNTAQVSIALQMMLQLEHIEYRLKYAVWTDDTGGCLGAGGLGDKCRPSESTTGPEISHRLPHTNV